MAETTVERQNLVEAINALPDDALVELASFLDYLHYKTIQRQVTEPTQQNFLLTVAGLGNSGQANVSDTDEEILRNEIDPIYGWGSQSKGQP
ncbi:hypothetical protein PN498_25910 [Oscillatoria sp. CS-180]|uniref:hypothetical protein n=1 Tax=Oscillatoria sp. CS-180 TaxID=3021720 RepID=UPI00232DCE01|nr:hypothetical protein [Oscillatoria sp. CS-180]MDB9529452.1 hypothetical protein [Oscillatoria sp. CS-180]